MYEQNDMIDYTYNQHTTPQSYFERHGFGTQPPKGMIVFLPDTWSGSWQFEHYINAMRTHPLISTQYLLPVIVDRPITFTAFTTSLEDHITHVRQNTRALMHALPTNIPMCIIALGNGGPVALALRTSHHKGWHGDVKWGGRRATIVTVGSPLQGSMWRQWWNYLVDYIACLLGVAAVDKTRLTLDHLTHFKADKTLTRRAVTEPNTSWKFVVSKYDWMTTPSNTTAPANMRHAHIDENYQRAENQIIELDVGPMAMPYHDVDKQLNACASIL